jgi:hypothetical protein
MNIRLEQVVFFEPNQTLDAGLLSIVFRFENSARINVDAYATRTLHLRGGDDDAPVAAP